MALGGAAAACGDESETTSEGVDPGPTLSLTAMFPRDLPYLAAEVPSRLVYALTDVEGVPLSEIAGPVRFTVSFDGEQVGDPVEVAPRAEEVPKPYLPLGFTFPRPGLYDVHAEVDGERLNSQVQVADAEDVRQPLVGGPLPPTSTPTTSQSFDVTPICTRSPEICPFHSVELTQALGARRPVVLLLASPAYCRTTACGPILETLIDLVGDRQDLAVIHAEVYKDPASARDLSSAELAPLPKDYAMPFEPCLFVADSGGTVVARGDIAVDRSEMAEMLALAV